MERAHPYPLSFRKRSPARAEVREEAAMSSSSSDSLEHAWSATESLIPGRPDVTLSPEERKEAERRRARSAAHDWSHTLRPLPESDVNPQRQEAVENGLPSMYHIQEQVASGTRAADQQAPEGRVLHFSHRLRHRQPIINDDRIRPDTASAQMIVWTGGVTTGAWELHSKHPSAKIGVMIAGNSGQPGGSCGDGNKVRSIHPGHRTHEEDVFSSWMLAEAGD